VGTQTEEEFCVLSLQLRMGTIGSAANCLRFCGRGTSHADTITLRPVESSLFVEPDVAD
jgi:hypothetical protein